MRTLQGLPCVLWQHLLVHRSYVEMNKKRVRRKRNQRPQAWETQASEHGRNGARRRGRCRTKWGAGRRHGRAETTLLRRTGRECSRYGDLESRTPAPWRLPGGHRRQEWGCAPRHGSIFLTPNWDWHHFFMSLASSVCCIIFDLTAPPDGHLIYLQSFAITQRLQGTFRNTTCCAHGIFLLDRLAQLGLIFIIPVDAAKLSPSVLGVIVSISCPLCNSGNH